MSCSSKPARPTPPSPPSDAGPPAGWYPDPAGHAEFRYWDGSAWTPGVVRGGRVTEEPLPWAAGSFPPPTPREQRAEWPARVAFLSLAGALVSTVVAGLGGLLGLSLSGGSDFIGLVGAQTALWTGLLVTCWGVSRRYGSGRLVADFALRFRRADVGLGIALAAAARLLGVVVVVPIVVLLDEPLRSNLEAVDDVARGVGGVALVVALVLVGAPLVEEMFFRGLLQRSLEARFHRTLAVAVQALVFGLAHLSGRLGVVNVAVFAATALAGVVFGVAALRYGRLGPGIAAHAWFNLLPALVIAFG